MQNGYDRTQLLMSRRLNLGSGTDWKKPGWTTIDHKASWLRRGGSAWRIGLPDDTVDLLFSSHMLEHIPHFKVDAVLQECNRVMSKGGGIRLLCPDLARLARAYVEPDGATLARFRAEDPTIRTDLGPGGEFMNFIVSPGSDSLLLSRTGECIGGYAHLYAYDFEMLKALLERNGFGDVRRCSFLESRYAEFDEPLHAIGAAPEWQNEKDWPDRSAGLTGFDRDPLTSLIIEAVKVADVHAAAPAYGAPGVRGLDPGPMSWWSVTRGYLDFTGHKLVDVLRRGKRRARRLPGAVRCYVSRATSARLSDGRKLAIKRAWNTANLARDGLVRAVIASMATLVDRWRYFRAYRSTVRRAAASSRAAAALPELKRRGYIAFPGYYSSAQCQRLRAEIDRVIHEQPDVVQKDKFDADQRVFGAERASTEIALFHDDPFLREIGEAYRRSALTNFTTLASRLTARPENLGSGQGWHRDAFHWQYKALIYLTDVGPENGPFQMLAGSHRPWRVLIDTIRGRLEAPPRSRISDDQIARLVNAAPERLKTFTAEAGTMILFDSSTIHRGAPIKSGIRYALTNYYYPPDHIGPVVVEKFAPYARPAEAAAMRSQHQQSEGAAT